MRRRRRFRPAFANTNQGTFHVTNTVAGWWRGFNDPQLNQLVDRALASNLDLRIATANLRQARALRFGAAADFLPVVTGTASYNNQRFSRAALFNAPGAPREQDLYDAGFDAAWELDILAGAALGGIEQRPGGGVGGRRGATRR